MIRRTEYARNEDNALYDEPAAHAWRARGRRPNKCTASSIASGVDGVAENEFTLKSEACNVPRIVALLVMSRLPCSEVFAKTQHVRAKVGWTVVL